MRRFDMREIAEIEISRRCTKRKEEATKFQKGEHKWLGRRVRECSAHVPCLPEFNFSVSRPSLFVLSSLLLVFVFHFES